MTTATHAEHRETPTDTADPTTHATGPVLIVGGTGFIASAILTQLLHSHGTPDHRPHLHVLSRKAHPNTDNDRIRHVIGDLTEPAGLKNICAGIETVVHAASYVGPDPHQCKAVNHIGTRALLHEAHRHGVQHFLYISTAAVYGTGPHHGPHEEQINPAPTSIA